jgi:hypothetical protein
MKRILICAVLLSASLAWGQNSKAYDHVEVTVTSTWVNGNGVRLVNASSDNLRFLFTCNEDQATCSAPRLNAKYIFSGGFDSDHFYQCDEYVMFPLPLSKQGALLGCIKDVSAK